MASARGLLSRLLLTLIVRSEVQHTSPPRYHNAINRCGLNVALFWNDLGTEGRDAYHRTTGARFAIDMLSAISAKGELRFMLTEERVSADLFIVFLKRRIRGVDYPIFLILDGNPVHRSVKVREFVESTEGELEPYFLPGYSPELNPDEIVWSYVKHHNMGNQVIAAQIGSKRLRFRPFANCRNCQCSSGNSSW